MIAGSRRVSKTEFPPELPGLEFAEVKALMAACRLYSSSTCLRFFERRKNQTPPAMAAIATTPTTTPAAMPALLGPVSPALDEAEAVTTIVWPPIVTTDGADETLVDPAFGVAVADVDAVVDDEVSALVIEFFTPAFHTVQYDCTPPVCPPR